VDALVLSGALHDAGLRLPVVETWDLPADPVDMAVGISNPDAGRPVAAHLVARQRRRIAFIGADEERSLQRLAGLREGLQAAGLPPPETELVPPPSSIAEGGTLLHRLLERVPELDAVFCNSDTLAVGALFEGQRRRLDVPGQLALVGFSDLPIAAQCVPALSTVHGCGINPVPRPPSKAPLPRSAPHRAGLYVHGLLICQRMPFTHRQP
jgi:LacI family gluconate utilization system Gnt-I transcriptional repressor